MYLFEGHSANEVWYQAAQKLINQKDALNHEGRGGPTVELLHSAFSIKDPLQRWVVSRSPAVNPAFALAEMIWIVTGRQDAAFLTFWNRGLTQYVGNSRVYHGAYGYRLRHQFGVDQLDRACFALTSNPNTRQVVLQIWDARLDFPFEDGKPVDRDIPCNVMALLKVRDDRLEWLQIMRSNDIHRGTPYNFVQFTSLQEIVAGWLGVGVGTYTHISDSLHFYHKDAKLFSVNNVLLDKNTDSLSLPKIESEEVFRELAVMVEAAMVEELTETQLYNMVHQNGLPESFKNILRLLGAEAARRKKWPELSNGLASECTNPILLQVWSIWSDRFT